ncbi:FXYD domain-containing ion transport regulator 3 isoform X2 [Microcaecilia unicolor]|uniref:FXYD domain-containing ion transport regulator n=1 Tax=Microcaecilia unicolor TaxID=1415580 RepID=A0A6P7YWH3_9AMPH|nr:FXYD domain-containing ion transport regulator 3 isoform X2 [Microcaecilia unicolor]
MVVPRRIHIMQPVRASFFLALAALPVLKANDPEDKDSPFFYDYHALRVGGLICAAILCVLGIIVLLSGKCRCKFNQKNRNKRRSESQVQQQLITPGSATNC